jgi:hypothetical protein
LDIRAAIKYLSFTGLDMKAIFCAKNFSNITLQLSTTFIQPNIYRVGQSIVDYNVVFFSMYGPSCLIEAYGGPEKKWLLYAGLLANHPLNLNFIFHSKGIMAAGELVARSCGCILPLTGPILRRWMDVGHPN